MFLAIAMLLIHPQLAATTTLSAENVLINVPGTISGSTSAENSYDALPFTTATFDAATQPATESSASLPEAPAPVPPAVKAPAPIAFLSSGKAMTVSVDQLRAENRRQQFMWRGLVIASSGAATFDAWSTRRAITTYGAVELNPLLRPFAGNASLYAAIQVGPALMDLAGKKMMYSRHSWVRHIWWVPQTASYVSSILCGAHNLSYR
jgi:hypothetical protein